MTDKIEKDSSGKLILKEIAKWMIPLFCSFFLAAFKYYETTGYGIKDFFFSLKSLFLKMFFIAQPVSIEGNAKIFWADIFLCIVFILFSLLSSKNIIKLKAGIKERIINIELFLSIFFAVGFSTDLYSFIWTRPESWLCSLLKVYALLLLSGTIFISLRQDICEKIVLFYESHKKVFTCIFVIAFAEVYYRQFIEDTTLTVLTTNYRLFHGAFNLAINIMLILAILKILIMKDEKRQRLCLILLYFSIYYSGIHDNDRNVVAFFFTMIAAIDELPEIVLGIGMAENIGLLIFAFPLTMNGTISNFNGISLGIINSTNYSAHLFMIMLAYCILRRFILPWYSYAILTLLTILGIHIQHGKTDFVLMILLIALCFINQLRLIIGKKVPSVPKKIISFFIIFAQPIIFVFTYIGTFTYYKNPASWDFLAKMSEVVYRDVWTRYDDMINSFSSNRIRLMGTNVLERGWGVSDTYRVGENVVERYAENYYTFVDEVPARLILIGGIIMTAIFLSFFIMVSKKLIDRHMVCLAVSLVFFALQGFMEQFSVRYAFNYVIIAIFMYAVNEKYKNGMEVCVEQRKVKES